jgi:hypothetical protein
LLTGHLFPRGNGQQKSAPKGRFFRRTPKRPT